MKQLGNLAVVCAQRPDVLMQIYGSEVSVHTGAVSYTHLDVYKRQPLTLIGKLQKLCVTIPMRNTHAPGMKPNRSRSAPGPHLRGPGRPLQVILLPVSYTHLDVYKRQIDTIER